MVPMMADGSRVIDVGEQYLRPCLVISLTAQRVVLSGICQEGGIVIGGVVEFECVPIIMSRRPYGITLQDPEAVSSAVVQRERAIYCGSAGKSWYLVDEGPVAVPVLPCSANVIDFVTGSFI